MENPEEAQETGGLKKQEKAKEIRKTAVFTKAYIIQNEVKIAVQNEKLSDSLFVYLIEVISWLR